MSKTKPPKMNATEKRVMAFYNNGLDDIDIAEEMQMDEAEVADIIDRFESVSLSS